MKLVRGEVIFTLVVLLILIPMMAVTYNWPLSARMVPWVAGIPTTLLLIVLLVRIIRRLSHGGSGEEKPGSYVVEVIEAKAPVAVVIRRGLPPVIGIMGLVLFAWIFGFPIAIPVFAFIYLKVAGRESWLVASVVSIIMGAIVYFLLDQTLRVGWPHSLFGS